MTGMLASVTSVEEAKIVLDAGVDIIDVKNPHEGALGALDLNAVKDIVQMINRQMLTSATIGDINPDDAELLNYIINMSETGVDYVKIGLFDKEPSDYFIETIIKATNKGIKLVIVLFAENYQGIDSVRSLLKTGITGIMIDTKEKKSKNLCSVLNDNELLMFVKAAKQNNLLTGLAGSLRFEDVSSLLKLNSDYLGFRGALCSANDRINEIDSTQVKKIREAIPHQDYINFQDEQLKEAII